MTSQETARDAGREPPASTELKAVNAALQYQDATAEWIVPSVARLNEERFANFDLQAVSHLVLIISLSRQEQIMRQVGVCFDNDHPAPFWHFIGKIISTALFERDDCLQVMTNVSVPRAEYVAFATRRYLDGHVTSINAPEAMFKRPQPGGSMTCFWKPARQLVLYQLHKWLQEPIFLFQ